jgi:hypothetical protein
MPLSLSTQYNIGVAEFVGAHCEFPSDGAQSGKPPSCGDEGCRYIACKCSLGSSLTAFWKMFSSSSSRHFTLIYLQSHPLLLLTGRTSTYLTPPLGQKYSSRDGCEATYTHLGRASQMVTRAKRLSLWYGARHSSIRSDHLGLLRYRIASKVASRRRRLPQSLMLCAKL